MYENSAHGKKPAKAWANALETYTNASIAFLNLADLASIVARCGCARKMHNC
jgi:hypothetical protein